MILDPLATEARTTLTSISAESNLVSSQSSQLQHTSCPFGSNTSADVSHSSKTRTASSINVPPLSISMQVPGPAQVSSGPDVAFVDSGISSILTMSCFEDVDPFFKARKRGRGRPKRERLPTDEIVPKKGRGRPKKVKNDPSSQKMDIGFEKAKQLKLQSKLILPGTDTQLTRQQAAQFTPLPYPNPPELPEGVTLSSDMPFTGNLSNQILPRTLGEIRPNMAKDIADLMDQIRPFVLRSTFQMESSFQMEKTARVLSRRRQHHLHGPGIGSETMQVENSVKKKSNRSKATNSTTTYKHSNSEPTRTQNVVPLLPRPPQHGAKLAQDNLPPQWANDGTDIPGRTNIEREHSTAIASSHQPLATSGVDLTDYIYQLSAQSNNDVPLYEHRWDNNNGIDIPVSVQTNTVHSRSLVGSKRVHINYGTSPTKSQAWEARNEMALDTSTTHSETHTWNSRAEMTYETCPSHIHAWGSQVNTELRVDGSQEPDSVHRRTWNHDVSNELPTILANNGRPPEKYPEHQIYQNYVHRIQAGGIDFTSMVNPTISHKHMVSENDSHESEFSMERYESQSQYFANDRMQTTTTNTPGFNSNFEESGFLSAQLEQSSGSLAHDFARFSRNAEKFSGSNGTNNYTPLDLAVMPLPHLPLLTSTNSCPIISSALE
eukprot:CFRG5529T1